MKKWILLTIFILPVSLVAGVLWLFYTPSGARFFLSSAARATPFEIKVGTVTGRLATGLELTNVEVRSAGHALTVKTGKVRFFWRPVRLLDGTFAVDQLRVSDVHISDNRPQSRGWPPLIWPRTPRLLAGAQGWIREFGVERVRYDRLGGGGLSIDRMSARLFWHHGILSLAGFGLDGPSYSARGTLEAGFLIPLLKADMRLALGHGPGGTQRVSMRADLTAAPASREPAGTLFADLATNGNGRLVIDSRIGITEHGLNVGSFSLSIPELAGSVTGRGSIEITADRSPRMYLDARLVDVRRKEGGAEVMSLSGEVHGEGTPDGYGGTFRLFGKGTGSKPKPWQVARADGTIQGDLRRAALSIGQGQWLGGKVSGSVEATWGEGFHLSSTLRGRRFDPAYLSPDWKGTINVNAVLDLAIDAASGVAGTVAAAFPESILRGRPLFGDLRATYRDRSLDVKRLDLHGKGFDIRASGALGEKLGFDVAVSDLSGLVPATSGSLVGNGWLRVRAGQIAGSVKGRGSAINTGYGRVERVQFSADLAGTGQNSILVDVSARGVGYEGLRADRVGLTMKGTSVSQTVDLAVYAGNSSAQLALRGGLREHTWDGTIASAFGRDVMGEWRLNAPARLQVSTGHVLFGLLRVSGPGKEMLSAQGDFFLSPLRGSLSGQWQALNLARLKPFLLTGTMEGTASGTVSVNWPEDVRARRLKAEVAVAGRYRQKTHSIPLRGTVHAGWDERGLAAGWEAALDGDGTASGTLASSGPPAFQLPERATVNAAWKSIDVASFAAWLPDALTMKGRLSGDVEGSILPGKAVSLKGKAEIAQGTVGWRTQNGTVNTAIQTGSATFSWEGLALRGEVSCALAGYGKVNGQFSLPLPARLPPAIVSDGPLMVSLRGQVREQGLVSAAMPGVLQEAKGLLDIDVKGGGTWGKPSLGGGATLKDASCYVPAAGIRLEKIAGAATLAGDTLQTRFRTESGGGWLEMSGDLHVRNGTPLTYQGTLTGSNFQALNLPDLRVYVSPRVTFKGDPKLMSARGEIEVPTMSIYGRRSEAAIRPSSDVRVIDAPVKEKKPLPFGLDIQVRVILGDKVRVDAAGLDGRLVGAVDLNITDVDRATANGRIRISEGRYRTYGVRLNVTRGNVIFAGPVERPALDILAVKQSGEVLSGVQVNGTIAKPMVNLYSNRPMSDSDKLAYIVLGHAAAQGDPGQSALFSGTAGIFEGGATPTMVSEAKARLGLAGTGGAYTGQNDQSSTIGVGRYLTPSFYVGLSRSTLTNENQITFRYNLSKKWEVESRAGGVTGMNLFYRIEFD